MKYVSYGLLLGLALAALIFVGFAFFSDVDQDVIMPYVFMGTLLYFFLVGFYISNTTCSFKEGLRAGFITGAVSMFTMAVAYFVAKNFIFLDVAIVHPDTIKGFERSGLMSIHRYLIYDTIRFGILGLVIGTLFAAFCAGGGSFTACHIHKRPRQ